jgi:hypothetical protein
MKKALTARKRKNWPAATKKSFARICGKSAKFSVLLLQTHKLPEGYEGLPKKSPFTSHGDFRRYLYEALIFSMPVF